MERYEKLEDMLALELDRIQAKGCLCENSLKQAHLIVKTWLGLETIAAMEKRDGKTTA